MAAPRLPLDRPRFTLDNAGVAAVLGGDEAVSAMATIHVYEKGRGLGWYNSPGSYQIARRYGLLARSRFSDQLSPGVHTDPAKLFELEGWKGPQFKAAHSRTVIEETGYLASLFMKECATLEGKVVEGRKTQSVAVTIAELNHVPPPHMDLKRTNVFTPIFASIPVFFSIGTCVACGVFEDWYSSSMILLGILTGGVCCLAIGSGKLALSYPESAKGSPPGDGILGSDNEFILLKGAEGAVNSITSGRISLSFSSESQFKTIGWCSVLLTIQCIAQLLLIPQGTLFGQIMFIASLGVSWLYNSRISSPYAKIQRDILFDNVLKKPILTKYVFGTRTGMVAFVLLVLQPEEPIKLLDELLPNDTKVWRKWKKIIARRFRNREKFEFVDAEWELEGFSEKERDLLKTLHHDASAGYRGYVHYSTSS